MEPLQVEAANSHLREKPLFVGWISLRELLVFSGCALEVRLGLQLTAKVEPESR